MTSEFALVITGNLVCGGTVRKNSAVFEEGASRAHTDAAGVYTGCMQKKMFWIIFAVLGLIADVVLPFWWAAASTIPIGVVSWWLAYRSDWF